MRGSVKVAAYGAIGGVLRFDLPGIGVAGVQVSQTMRACHFPGSPPGGRDQHRDGSPQPGRRSGRGELPVDENGAVLEEVEIPLAANWQVGPVYLGSVHRYGYV